MSLGLIALVIMLVFMLLAQFGALSVPLLVWIIWTVVAIVLLSIGTRWLIPPRQ